MKTTDDIKRQLSKPQTWFVKYFPMRIKKTLVRYFRPSFSPVPRQILSDGGSKMSEQSIRRYIRQFFLNG